MPRLKHFDPHQHELGEVAVPVVSIHHRPSIRVIDPQTREEALLNARSGLEYFRKSCRDRERAQRKALLRMLARRRIKPRIVLLDDDTATLEHTGETLRGWFKNAEILKFPDASLAWKELLRQAPDIFVTDFYHDAPTGEEMLSRLAELQVTFPILVVSGSAKEEQVRRCAGSTLKVSLLGKPWTESQLYREMANHLGRVDNPPLEP